MLRRLKKALADSKRLGADVDDLINKIRDDTAPALPIERPKQPRLR